MAKILVSACLVGICCRYKGDGKRDEEIVALATEHTLIPVCPEQLGGLPTPRDPAEQQGASVISKTGREVTEQYERGAEAALNIAQLYGVRLAILKSRSPSCGSGQIYDGSFSGKLVPGNGKCAALLKKNGIRVFSEENLGEICSALAMSEAETEQ